MKRSEIIREIKSIIATCRPTQPTIVTAEQVLDRLEKLGMLPPALDFDLPESNEWEEENE